MRLVSLAAGPVVVVAAPGQALPPLPDTVVVTRDPVRGRGPLQGLAAGLAALPETVDLAYATATDVPFFEPGWIGLLENVIGHHDLALPFCGSFFHPLAALYRRAVALPAIERLLEDDRLRPVLLMEALRSRIVTASELRKVDPELATLRNLNTPEEYQSALSEAGYAQDDEFAPRFGTHC